MKEVNIFSFFLGFMFTSHLAGEVAKASIFAFFLGFIATSLKRDLTLKEFVAIIYYNNNRR